MASTCDTAVDNDARFLPKDMPLCEMKRSSLELTAYWFSVLGIVLSVVVGICLHSGFYNKDIPTGYHLLVIMLLLSLTLGNSFFAHMSDHAETISRPEKTTFEKVAYALDCVGIFLLALYVAIHLNLCPSRFEVEWLQKYGVRRDVVVMNGCLVILFIGTVLNLVLSDNQEQYGRQNSKERVINSEDNYPECRVQRSASLGPCPSHILPAKQMLIKDANVVEKCFCERCQSGDPVITDLAKCGTGKVMYRVRGKDAGGKITL
jgi:hypothetical protein